MDGEPQESPTIRAVEFYSGIGGLHQALRRSRADGTVVRAYDWDQAACQVYQANYGPGIVKQADISQLTAKELGALRADLWLLSPSCQPYTVLNPLAKGSEDPRAKSFIHLMENVLPELAGAGEQPKYLLVENVAGFETSSTRERLLHTLHSLGYATRELLLTPLQFGVPNSRLRYYLLATARPRACGDAGTPGRTLWRHIPGHGAPWADPRGTSDAAQLDAVRPLREYLDPGDGPDECRVPDRVLERWGRLFDIVLPEGRRTCCFTRGYTKLAERAGSVLQLNEELDTTATFDRFLEEQKRGTADAVRLLDPLRLRYFSPQELLRLFCFDPVSAAGSGQFIWPETISNKTKYKLIGNSVNVEVVRHLINYLFD
ncbi:DNA methyltransferase [Phanerochaete sordida]|uniref:tRNA (cytosine(38)-C(5))-methyltransferase n=1 Tax=Phanerochaete sordida TaxID=48140 RepID=A0A9P3GIH8_9APHY|nr:DNA methyltransferase [Phanerochaete sordida]